MSILRDLLWKMLLTRLPNMTVSYGDRQRYGSCVQCSRPHRRVWIVTDGSAETRFCNRCWKEGQL